MLVAHAFEPEVGVGDAELPRPGERSVTQGTVAVKVGSRPADRDRAAGLRDRDRADRTCPPMRANLSDRGAGHPGSRPSVVEGVDARDPELRRPGPRCRSGRSAGTGSRRAGRPSGRRSRRRSSLVLHLAFLEPVLSKLDHGDPLDRFCTTYRMSPSRSRTVTVDEPVPSRSIVLVTPVRGLIGTAGRPHLPGSRSGGGRRPRCRSGRCPPECRSLP